MAIKLLRLIAAITPSGSRMLLIVGLAACAPFPALARKAGGGEAALVTRAAQALTLPIRRFTLANGLRVVVHTDRKAPVVGVSVRYAVGARDEGPGRSGFAHLFEHLMLTGSAAGAGDTVQAMRTLGALDANGQTGFDSTVFVETVPTGSVDRALFIEASRMAETAGSIDQATLDRNRAIVKNEMRQWDNAPGGAASTQAPGKLFPPGHPYGHTVYGSAAALDAATLADVRDWHRRHYGPDNAVLVLAGDIDLATAKRLVGARFGSLAARGRPVSAPAPVRRLPHAIDATVSDRVAQTIVTRHWPTPGRLAADSAALDVAAKALGTLPGAWLDEILVRREHLALSVVTSSAQSAGAGVFVISLTLPAGVTAGRALARLDTLIARFAKVGPTRDEVRRVTMREIGWSAASLETSLGKATTFGDGDVLAADPLFYREHLQAMARLTPDDVRRAAARWLTAPAFTLTTLPGAREASADDAAHPQTSECTAASAPAALPPATERTLPPIGPPRPTRFAAIHRYLLSNGIELVAAYRSANPLVQVAMTFDAGSSADPAGGAGLQATMMSALADGSTALGAKRVASARERLGAMMSFQARTDDSLARLTVSGTVLAPAMNLFADILRHPGFFAATMTRLASARAAMREQDRFNPWALAWQVIARRIGGPSSPELRDRAPFGTGIPADAGRLRLLHDAWIRPETAKLFILSDLPDAQVRTIAEHSFGDWRGNGAIGRKERVMTALPVAPPDRTVLLVDRPASAQTLIVGAAPAPVDLLTDPDKQFAATVANEALGGVRGRLNLDLREAKGWTYGVGGGFQLPWDAPAYVVSASVQADRAWDAVTLLDTDIADFVGARPITASEADQVIAEALLSLPARFERGDAVMDALLANDYFHRPDTYQARLFERYKGLSPDVLAAVARQAIRPQGLTWVMVGDARLYRPQIDRGDIRVVAP